MNWSHRVSYDWLTARKQYLSASDIKKLIPVTATGKPRSKSSIEEAYLKTWAEKQCRVTEDDVCSSGRMGRGHWLEPYAIAEFNKQKVTSELHHWDDILVRRGGMACSPDAVDVVQVEHWPVAIVGDGFKVLGETKAYEAGAHYAIGLSKSKSTIEERWQLAAGFFVMPDLERAFLIMYNPSAAHPLFWHEYSRVDLADELKMIEQVNKEYQSLVAEFENDALHRCPSTVSLACLAEEDIISLLIAEQEISAGLNP